MSKIGKKCFSLRIDELDNIDLKFVDKQFKTVAKRPLKDVIDKRKIF